MLTCGDVFRVVHAPSGASVSLLFIQAGYADLYRRILRRSCAKWGISVLLTLYGGIIIPQA